MTVLKITATIVRTLLILIGMAGAALAVTVAILAIPADIARIILALIVFAVSMAAMVFAELEKQKGEE